MKLRNIQRKVFSAFVVGSLLFGLSSEVSASTWTQQTALGQRYWYGITSSADGTKLAVSDYYSYIHTSID